MVPKLKMLARAAPWNSFRAQVALTQVKAVVINGVVQTTNLPPQPFQVEYAYPADCLKFRFVRPTLNVTPTTPPLTTAPNQSYPYPKAPDAIPFVVATDTDANNNPIKVILSDLYQAQGVYVRDLTSFPDLWDPMFRGAATALLGAYFINTLQRSKAQLDDAVAIAKSLVEQARAAEANESIAKIEHTPDWLQARMGSSIPWGWAASGPNGQLTGAWDSCEFPGGQFF